MKHLALALVIATGAVSATALGAPPASGRDHATASGTGSVLTGKERLGDKATDEQRVDDCKVLAARRTRPRPTACPWDVNS